MLWVVQSYCKNGEENVIRAAVNMCRIINLVFQFNNFVPTYPQKHHPEFRTIRNKILHGMQLVTNER